MTVWDVVVHVATTREVDSRAVAVQEVLLPAVVLREVLLAAVAAQEVLACVAVEQEVLARAAPLQEVLARILVVREVLARAVDGWDVVPAAVATREEIASADRGARWGTRAPPRPVYPSAFVVPLRGHPSRFCGKTGLLSDVEGRWGRMDPAVIASER